MFGRLWPWLLLVAAIVLQCVTMPAAELGGAMLNAIAALANSSAGLRANTTAAILKTISPSASNGTTLNATVVASDYAPSALTDPAVLTAVTAGLFVTWLLSLVAFFRLSKRDYWPTFWNNETAAEYTKRVKWDGQPDERLRALLLVKVHPSLLRLVAPEARIWIGKNWARWLKDKPDWFTDRWKRGLPDSVLSQQALHELGGQNRRRTTLPEQLGGVSRR